MRVLARWLLAVGFVWIGTLHFRRPRGFLKIVPPPLPAELCVYLSGVAEIVLGLAFPLWPRCGAFGLMALLLAVFPANLYMAVKQIKIKGMPSKPWMLWARLPMQPLLMLLVAWAGEVI